MKSTNKSFLTLLSFVSLIIIALLIFVNQFLPIVGIEIRGTLFNVLSTLERVFTLIVIGLLAFNFTAGKSKTVKIVFWVAVVIFIAGMVLTWF